MILVIGAGGMVGSALVRRFRYLKEPIGEVYSPWSGVLERNNRWAVDVTSTNQLRGIRQQPCPITKIYYCASRSPRCKTDADKFYGRVYGVAAVVKVFPGIPLIYCSSTRAGESGDSYAHAQQRCEGIVREAGGRFVRFPALYSSTYRPWLRWVKWVYPAWSVAQAVDALMEA